MFACHVDWRKKTRNLRIFRQVKARRSPRLDCTSLTTSKTDKRSSSQLSQGAGGWGVERGGETAFKMWRVYRWLGGCLSVVRAANGEWWRPAPGVNWDVRVLVCLLLYNNGKKISCVLPCCCFLCCCIRLPRFWVPMLQHLAISSFICSVCFCGLRRWWLEKTLGVRVGRSKASNHRVASTFFNVAATAVFDCGLSANSLRRCVDTQVKSAEQYVPSVAVMMGHVCGVANERVVSDNNAPRSNLTPICTRTNYCCLRCTTAVFL